VVRRWTRFGKDRLYVSTSDGQRVGWRDLASGALTVEAPQYAVELEAVLAAWAVLPATPPAANPSPAPWRDLATNRPGQMAREQAEIELAEMRERSSIGTFVARTLDLKTDERSWRVGAGGEEAVGARLEKLTDRGWFVLHSVPVGSRGSDIDHVMVGPGGVYTINTKTHPGKQVWVSPRQVRVNGQPVPYLRNSRHEATRAERLLSEAAGFPVIVKPVLVFLTGTLIPDVTIKQRPDDVLILDRMDIPRAFKRAPERLTPETVQAIFDVARRSSTWE